MSFDSGSRGGLKISFGKKSSDDSDLRFSSSDKIDLGIKVGLIAAIAAVSASLSNCTMEKVPDVVFTGAYQRLEVHSTDDGISVSAPLRLMANGKVLRNEPDLFVGKFWGASSMLQHDIEQKLKGNLGVKCDTEMNGWDFLWLNRNLIKVDLASCEPIAMPK